MDAERWQQALACFEKVQRLEPGYRETENLLSQARQQCSTVHAEGAKPGERQEGQQQGEQRHLSQRAVSPDSPSKHEPGREVGPERGERSKEVFGAAAAAVAGMGLIATGLVAMLSDQWFILFEVKAVIPILAAMVGSAGLYHRLASNTGRLGRVSFVMVFVSLLVLLVYPLVINLWPDVLIADLSIVRRARA
jgi:hypothetical protein